MDLEFALRNASRVNQRILTYHELFEAEPTYRYGISSAQFEQHLQLMIKIRQDGGARQLAIAFDDGHISNYIIALPLLEKYRHKAIFFIIAGRTGRDQDFMDWKQLKELVSLGHRVEAHSWSHAYLTHCSRDRLYLELGQSKMVIEDHLGIPVRSFSAPHGRWNRRVASVAAECGYCELYTSNPWMKTKRLTQLEIIGRMMVRGSMKSDDLQRLLEMSRTRSILARAQFGAKQSLRYTLGDSLYHRLWNWHSAWYGPNDTF